MSKRVMPGWLKQDSELYKQIYAWLESRAVHGIVKIGITGSGNIKYMSSDQALDHVEVVTTKHMPGKLIKQIDNADQFIAQQPALKDVKAVISAYAQNPDNAEKLESTWKDLCTKAHIKDIPRRNTLNKRAISSNDCSVTLPEPRIVEGLWREDGNYFLVWEKIYRDDIKNICRELNQKRLQQEFDQLLCNLKAALRPSIVDKLAKKYETNNISIDMSAVTIEDIMSGKIAIECKVPCNGEYGVGTITANVTLEKYIQLRCDGKDLDVATLPNKRKDSGTLHTFAFDILPNGSLKASMTRKMRQITLKPAYQDDVVKKLGESRQKANIHGFIPFYMYNPPRGVYSVYDNEWHEADFDYDQQTHTLTASCIFGILQADPQTHTFHFIKQEDFLAAAQNKELFKARQKICEAVQGDYLDTPVYRTFRMRIAHVRGYGILAGDTRVTFECDQERVELQFVMPKTEDNTAYEKAVRELFATAVRDLQQAIAAKMRGNRDKYWSIYEQILSDPLDMAILHYVDANNDYVTATAIQQALRGTKIQLLADLTSTDDCGRFNMLPGTEIVGEIARLERNGSLHDHIISGTYGDYALVKMSDQGWDILDVEASNNCQKAANWWENQTAFRAYLANIQAKLANHKDARQEQVELLHHLDNRHMVAYFHDDIVDAFPKEDTDLCKLIKIYRSMQSEDSLAWNMLGHILRGRHLNKTE